MTEFVALRAKLYAYKTLKKKEDKKCKGIKKCVVKKTLTFEVFRRRQKRIQKSVASPEYRP